MLKSILDAVMERRARQLMEQVGAWLPAEGPVLDLGSGTGHLSARLERELGLEVVTADVSDIHVVGPPPGPDRRRGPSVRGGNVLGRASLLHARLPERPGRCPGGSGSRHARTHHPGAVASFGSPGLRVASRPGVPLDDRGIPRVEAPRLRPSGREVHHEHAALLYRRRSFGGTWWRPGCGSGRGGSGRCCPARSLVVAGVDPRSAMSETSSLLRDPCAKRGGADRRGPGGHSRECGSSVGRLAERSLAPGYRRSRSSWQTTGARTPPRPSCGTFADDVGVRLVPCVGGTCAAARNAGAAASSGRVLCFVDADTIVPENAVDRILELHEDEGRCLVLYRLASREPGIRAWLWWTFWGLARRLPLARAKSMPAFMSCDRAHFESYGPFDESWAIAEEWPLTGAAYRYHRERFLYDRSLTARTSSRRMELQPFGYLRTFLKWVSVVLFPWARTSLTDRIRHETGNR